MLHSLEVDIGLDGLVGWVIAVLDLAEFVSAEFVEFTWVGTNFLIWAAGGRSAARDMRWNCRPLHVDVWLLESNVILASLS